MTAYEPAFGIIGDSAKKDPTTRQSADHSMVYIRTFFLFQTTTTIIVSTLLRKAFEDPNFENEIKNIVHLDEVWMKLMLEPNDFSYPALHNENTRKLMEKISFKHGGDE